MPVNSRLRQRGGLAPLARMRFLASPTPTPASRLGRSRPPVCKRSKTLSVAPSSSGKPTIVLAHGAFAESSSWDGVVRLLLDDDFPVIAVAVPLRGVKSDSAYLASSIAALEGD